MRIELTVNGMAYRLDVAAGETLLELLRREHSGDFRMYRIQFSTN